MTIGICGTGRMGAAMAERLLGEGRAVEVWNRTAERAAELVKMGATQAPTPAILMDNCDIVIAMLFDGAAQMAVYKGPDGLLASVTKDTLIVDMSTMMPEVSQALAKLVDDAGFDFLECPVGGTVAPAKAGKLLGMAGGQAGVYERAQPVLAQLCRRVEHVGPVGCGAAMKLAVNLPLATYWEALGEALSLAVAGGVDAELAGSMMADSSGAIGVAGPRIPMIIDAMAAQPSAPGTFDIAGMSKDLAFMCQYAEKNGFDTPLANAARTAYNAASGEGWANNDAAVMAAWRFRKNTGK